MAGRRRSRKKKRKDYEPLFLLVALIALFGFGWFAISRWWNGRNLIDEEPPRIFFNSYGIHIPPNYQIHGIDVSKYQGVINWELVRNMEDGGVKLGFVFMKATEGKDRVDHRFERNWSAAKKVGIVRGAYHFFNPYKDGKEQAEHFIEHVKLEKGDLPPVLDIETIGSVSERELRKRAKTFLDILERHYRVKPIIYTSVKFYEHRLGDEFNEYPLWVAHYLQFDAPRINREWQLWQHSEKGQVSGIKGNVDFNVFNGDSAEFRMLVIGD